MSDFKTRLEEESKELSEKLQKLTLFIMSDNFNSLEEMQQSLLLIQSQSMQTYSLCLIERLKLLNK